MTRLQKETPHNLSGLDVPLLPLVIAHWYGDGYFSALPGSTLMWGCARAGREVLEMLQFCPQSVTLRLRSRTSNAIGIDFLPWGVTWSPTEELYRLWRQYSQPSIRRVNSHESQEGVYPNLKSSQKRRFLSWATSCNSGQASLSYCSYPDSSNPYKPMVFSFQITTHNYLKGCHYIISLNIFVFPDWT